MVIVQHGLNEQAERVIYKNDFRFGIAIMNMYMTYGGTNWGNLGFPVSASFIITLSSSTGALNGQKCSGSALYP